MTRPYISAVQPNLFDGKFSCRLEFGPGLNVLSGENGTGKTQLLRLMKSQRQIEISDGRPPKQVPILAISPQRNAERKNLQAIVQEFRRQNKNLNAHLAKIIQMELRDDTFVTYPSVGELFYLGYEAVCRDGGNQIEKMEQVVSEFNGVIASVFEEFRLWADWDESAGLPKLQIEKTSIGPVALEALSCGEKEILSLVLNLYTARDKDVVIIDEPEVHLNWHLEYKLFDFLKQFCESHGQQFIVATHSRAVFLPKFLPHVQFLYWKDGEVCSSRELGEEMRRRIAGEAIEIIKLGDFQNATFFVEDAAHEEILQALADALRVKIPISQAGNSENVKSLFKLSTSEGGWRNCYFLVDGDNQGNPFPEAENFIHLSEYCLENYLLDFEICAAVTAKSTEEVKTAILQAIQKNKEKILRKNKYFEFLVSRLSVDDIDQESLGTLDASEIVDDVIRSLGSARKRFIKEYIRHCHDRSQLTRVFPEQLIEAVKSAAQEAN